MGNTDRMMAGISGCHSRSGRCLFAAKPGFRPAGKDAGQTGKRRTFGSGDAGGRRPSRRRVATARAGSSTPGHGGGIREDRAWGRPLSEASTDSPRFSRSTNPPDSPTSSCFRSASAFVERASSGPRPRPPRDLPFLHFDLPPRPPRRSPPGRDITAWNVRYRPSPRRRSRTKPIQGEPCPTVISSISFRP